MHLRKEPRDPSAPGIYGGNGLRIVGSGTTEVRFFLPDGKRIVLTGTGSIGEARLKREQDAAIAEDKFDSDGVYTIVMPLPMYELDEVEAGLARASEKRSALEYEFEHYPPEKLVDLLALYDQISAEEKLVAHYTKRLELLGGSEYQEPV